MEVNDPANGKENSFVEGSATNSDDCVTNETKCETEDFCVESEAVTVDDSNNDDAATKQDDQTDVDTGMDDLFNQFIDEINCLPTTRPKTNAFVGVRPSSILSEFGTPEQECLRMTIKMFANSFEVLNLTADATEEEIKRQYRKISLLIHPDKCKHEKAQEAFNILNKAYEELQLPEFKEKYRKVLLRAKKLVLKERKKKNVILKITGQDILPEDEDSLKQEVAAKCEQLCQEQAEQRAYAERTRKANENREKQQEDELLKAEKVLQEQKKVWAETRNIRVDSWRDFQSHLKSDKKQSCFLQVKHKKEQRAPHHDKADNPTNSFAANKRRKNNVDDSYKEQWR